MTYDMYQKMLRIGGTVMAVVFWFVSMNFSYDGFNISVPNMAWVGVVLAIGVTVVELVWNKQGMSDNLTLAAAGILCYVYGIYTNVMGILIAQGLTPTTAWENPAAFIFPAILGTFLEVVPEPLLVWGLVGITSGGDFLGNIFGQVKAMNNQNQGQYAPPNPNQGGGKKEQHQPQQAQKGGNADYHSLNEAARQRPQSQQSQSPQAKRPVAHDWPGRRDENPFRKS